MSFLQQSNLKLNAAGLTPDHSLTLPERAPQADEQEILQAIQEFYSSTASSSSLPLQIFSPQVVVTRSNGEVHVGIQGLQLRSRAIQGQAIRSTRLRLLATPEALAPRTMCIDLITCAQDANEGSRTLLVLKRNAKDGLITSVTEEEGHRRATAPLAARAASAGNFCSPTDNMLSPCTSKLNLAKKKHHLKGKPTTLFAAQMANKAPSQLVDDMDF